MTKTIEAVPVPQQEEPTSSPGTGHLGQTFLVGEEVYLRTFELGDEKNAASWRNSIFPKSTELVKKWIEEELPKAGKNKQSFYAIVRKADDIIVGSIQNRNEDTIVEIIAHVDPLYGEQGQRWKAEAITLCAGWGVDERHLPSVGLELPTSETIVIDILKAFGMRETARWREMFLVDGERVDCVF
jgi:RimJ/RimL family protein N-acetyltransferase